jgi:FixJ family two-component response regulator
VPARRARGYCAQVDPAESLIAVVDDELPVRTMLGRLLRLADYRVSAYASGEEFLASVALRDTPRPSCAILDVHMPGMSGLEVQSHLRAKAVRIPIVMITASDDIALDRAALEAGAVGLLRKPFSNRDLLGAIDAALQHAARIAGNAT